MPSGRNSLTAARVRPSMHDALAVYETATQDAGSTHDTYMAVAKTDVAAAQPVSSHGLLALRGCFRLLIICTPAPSGVRLSRQGRYGKPGTCYCQPALAPLLR